MNNFFSFSLTFLFAATLITSCQKGNNPINESESIQLTADEKAAIKKDISNRINDIIQGAKELNVEKAASVYSDDPEFRIVNPDGTVTDFETMKKGQLEGFKGLKSLNFSTIKQDFTFLTKDLVMCTWTGINEFELTTGEKMKVEPYVGSLLFKNKEGVWKIIYAHETTASPTPIK